MRYVFGCTPSELDEQDADRVDEVLDVMSAEQKIRRKWS